MEERVALVVGAGNATGGASRDVFAREGYAAAMTRRARNLDQLESLARELGPKGIHVVHVVIDGAIDTQWIAETYWLLHQQPRSAWTHELDLRSWIEPW